MSRIRKGDRVVMIDVANEKEIFATVRCAKYPILEVQPDTNPISIDYWHVSECDKVTDLLKKI